MVTLERREMRDLGDTKDHAGLQDLRDLPVSQAVQDYSNT